jgi:hypothetical protein
MKNETAQARVVQEVRPATVGQVKDILGLTAQAIPVKLTFEVARDVLGRKTEFIEYVRAFFPDPADLSDAVKQWQTFYRKAFDLAMDTSVKIPERTEAQEKTHTRLLIITQGLTSNQVFDACAKRFRCWRHTDDLNSGVPTNERDPKNGAYAIWVRDTVEADECHRNKSANMVQEEGLKTETLLERMLHELKYFLETGKHLDIQNVTLCSGSRLSDGYVPSARWRGDKFRVYWNYVDNRSDDLRPREVISLV